jgi:hypothetical protein
MKFEEFTPAAIACAIGWMAAGADRQLRDTYFTRWAVAMLVEERFTFEFLMDFEGEIRRRYTSIGLPHLAPSLATFVAHNQDAALRNALRDYRPGETVPSGALEHKAQEPRRMLTSAPTGGGSATSAPPAIVSRPGDNARAAGRPLYADECPECRQDPCACGGPPMSCRYYGKNGMFGRLIHQGGNQCALIVDRYAPCQMEVPPRVPGLEQEPPEAPDETVCLIVARARQIHGLVDLLEWPARPEVKA